MENEKIYLCNRCGFPVDLNNLHPDSLSIPDGEYGEDWTAVHGSGEFCGDDDRAWVIELK